jgi:hypothetical protein
MPGRRRLLAPCLAFALATVALFALATTLALRDDDRHGVSLPEDLLLLLAACTLVAALVNGAKWRHAGASD